MFRSLQSFLDVRNQTLDLRRQILDNRTIGDACPYKMQFTIVGRGLAPALRNNYSLIHSLAGSVASVSPPLDLPWVRESFNSTGVISAAITTQRTIAGKTEESM